MARRVTPKAKRSYTLRVRLRPDEITHIRGAAKNLTIPMSDFARRKLLGAQTQLVPRKSTLPVDTLALIRELGPIGINLNQLVRYAHAGAIDAAALDAAIAEVLRVLTGVKP